MSKALIGNVGAEIALTKHVLHERPLSPANAPPIDVFPAYDKQPGPSTDDYIRIRITLQRPIFMESHRSQRRWPENHTRAFRLPMPKIPYAYNISDKKSS